MNKVLNYVARKNIDNTVEIDKIKEAIKNGEGARLDLGKEAAFAFKSMDQGYGLSYYDTKGWQRQRAFTYNRLKLLMVELAPYHEWQVIEGGKQ